jgi:hypothetical protein
LGSWWATSKPKEPKPKDAKKWGKCPGCGEIEWLFEYEGTYDDPNDLMCEACIDEFHARVHEAEDAMADMVDTDAWTDLAIDCLNLYGGEWASEELGCGDEDY